MRSKMAPNSFQCRFRALYHGEVSAFSHLDRLPWFLRECTSETSSGQLPFGSLPVFDNQRTQQHIGHSGQCHHHICASGLLNLEGSYWTPLGRMEYVHVMSDINVKVRLTSHIDVNLNECSYSKKWCRVFQMFRRIKAGLCEADF